MDIEYPIKLIGSSIGFMMDVPDEILERNNYKDNILFRR